MRDCEVQYTCTLDTDVLKRFCWLCDRSLDKLSQGMQHVAWVLSGFLTQWHVQVQDGKRAGGTGTG